MWLGSAAVHLSDPARKAAGSVSRRFVRLLAYVFGVQRAARYATLSTQIFDHRNKAALGTQRS